MRTITESVLPELSKKGGFQRRESGSKPTAPETLLNLAAAAPRGAAGGNHGDESRTERGEAREQDAPVRAAYPTRDLTHRVGRLKRTYYRTSAVLRLK